jgi:tRNA(Ile2) C34 agmatinyltransferase TiaS
MIFKQGRCPFCGSFGKSIGEDMFHCAACEAVFDRFFVFSEKDIEIEWC